MIEATVFPDVEAAVIAALQPHLAGVIVSNKTPSPIPAKLVTVGYSGGGSRDWFEAGVNVGVNVYAQSDDDQSGVAGCRTFSSAVQDILAAVSNDLIENVQAGAGGGTSVPRQSPPFQRYFAATVYLRAQSLLDLS